MSFKVCRDGQGIVICYGPNDDNYEPTLPYTVEDVKPSPTQAQIDAAAKVAKDAADALAAKQDTFVATVAGFSMAQVDNFVDTNFASSTAAQKNFFKALGKIAVISARKL